MREEAVMISSKVTAWMDSGYLQKSQSW